MKTFSTLVVGCDYRCTNGTIIHYLGNGEGLTKNLATNKKVRISRKRVAARMMDVSWAAGCAAALGCTTEYLPNNALHIFGTESDLKEMTKVIGATHGFSPLTTLYMSVDGVPQPGYPRIEVHPVNVTPPA